VKKDRLTEFCCMFPWSLGTGSVLLATDRFTLHLSASSCCKSTQPQTTPNTPHHPPPPFYPPKALSRLLQFPPPAPNSRVVPGGLVLRVRFLLRRHRVSGSHGSPQGRAYWRVPSFFFVWFFSVFDHSISFVLLLCCCDGGGSKVVCGGQAQTVSMPSLMNFL